MPLKRFIATLLIFSLLCSSAYTETGKASSECREETQTEHYRRGLELAKNDGHCAGSLAAGFIVGFSLPFVAGGSAALAYQCTSDCAFCGIVAGAAVPVFTVRGVRKLISKNTAPMPDEYGRGLRNTELTLLSSGYEYGKREKREKMYNLGVAAGVLTIAGAVLYICYSLRNENFAPGV